MLMLIVIRIEARLNGLLCGGGGGGGGLHDWLSTATTTEPFQIVNVMEYWSELITVSPDYHFACQ